MNTIPFVSRTRRNQKVAPLGNAIRILEHEDAAKGANADQSVGVRLGLQQPGKVAKLGPVVEAGSLRTFLIIGGDFLPTPPTGLRYLWAMHNVAPHLPPPGGQVERKQDNQISPSRRVE